MGDSALVDLVCGPVSPLPETYQRYRLVARLGSGGQADVFRGVRLCGGVTSAPVTVKVFRLDPKRPLVDELRSWDKGDAALMDLNNRAVPGICRRVDGFYGPVPHASGDGASTSDAVPYQVYDYLHGVNLREYVTSRAGLTGAHRLSAPVLLGSLADTLRAMHHPDVPGSCPVLHMDVKPSNVMVLASGDTRLIDFTGTRYWRAEEITRIAYTPESGGPEALRGEVAPAYDVHGFGSVAFYLLTGSPPRGTNAPALHQNPLFDGRPALRDHLLAVLADEPADRPSTTELAGWALRLGTLVRASQAPDLGLDWRESIAGRPVVGAVERRAVGRARPVVAGTETDAYQRIQILERELVALRARVARAAEAVAPASPAAVFPGAVYPAPVSPGAPATAVARGGLMPFAPLALPAGPAGASPVGSAAAAPVGAAAVAAAGAQAGSPVGAAAGRDPGPKVVVMRPGRAVVVPRPSPQEMYRRGGNGYAGPGQPGAGHPGGGQGGAGYGGAGYGGGYGGGSRGTLVETPAGYPADGAPIAPSPFIRMPRRDRMRDLKRGGTWSVVGVSFAFACWIIWAAANRSRGVYLAPTVFAGTLAVALGVFIVLRLVGRMVLEQWMHRTRKGAVGAHLGTGAFLIAVGVTYLQQTSWIVSAFHWLHGL